MTIEEAKEILPPELKYPLPEEVLDNLLGIQRIAIDMSEPDEKGMHYAMLAVLIELKERRERGEDGRKELVQSVCDSFSEEYYGYDSENDYYAGFDDGLKRAIRLMIAKVREQNGRE